MTDLKRTPKSLLDHARCVAKESDTAEDIDAAFPPADGVDYESRHQRIGTILALAVMKHLFTPADLALLRCQAGIALVVKVPDRDWVKPISRALQHYGAPIIESAQPVGAPTRRMTPKNRDHLRPRFGLFITIAFREGGRSSAHRLIRLKLLAQRLTRQPYWLT